MGRKVCDLKWGLFASEAYLKNASPLKHAADLQHHTLIGGTGAMLDLPAFSWLEKQYGHRIQTRCDELTAMSYFAENDHGVALLPADQTRSALRPILFLDHLNESQIWLLTHPDLRKTERIRIVMDALARYFERWQVIPTSAD